QQTHFAKANTVIGGGVVKLILEKKRGRHNDDPKRFQSEYATGFLQTRGKFTQRYGYFEARMKLPTAPGLWPAFWMMPDRGGKGGGGTNAGGMEFDVMEHLTRYGPHRYNIAMHWDGYGKDHKSTGTDGAYVRADKDGFVTAGLLWLPGKAVYYCNGKEVARWTNDRIASVPSELMFTLPVGGWDNDAVDDAKLPGEFVIDYVRVWQRKDLK
ncbi:MAG TPA: glycoside hydrolase family 16 protein, partial [Tepidisphaeraceae bacterium]|nr:glycoside hydrolase family 16 protein [Tepidisphaeraceae bacterium]